MVKGSGGRASAQLDEIAMTADDGGALLTWPGFGDGVANFGLTAAAAAMFLLAALATLAMMGGARRAWAAAPADPLELAARGHLLGDDRGLDAVAGVTTGGGEPILE
jgi:hypothetical protein